MQATVRFTDVYGGREHVREETIDVAAPEPDDAGDDFYTWAEDNLYPLTGDGNATTVDAGYFAEVIACDQEPALIGREFSWGI